MLRVEAVGVLGAVITAALVVPLGAQPGGPRRGVAQVTSVSEVTAVRPGTAARVAVMIRLPRGFHTNSNRPRASNLIPLTLTVPPTAVVAAKRIAFPPASDLAQAGDPVPLSVFEDRFAIGVELEIAPDARRGDLSVPFTVHYQACDEKQCYLPATINAAFSLNIEPDAVSTPTHGDVFSTMAFVPVASAGPHGGAAVPLVRNTTNPLALIDRFNVAAVEGGYLTATDFKRLLTDSQHGVTRSGVLEGRGPLAILLLVFVGGIALNLTPCVLPMIPINLAIIGAGAQAGSRWRGLLLGSVYGGAMAFVYGVLGLIVILTARTFGAVNASPWFNLGVAALFVTLALAMLDLFEIDLSRFSGRVGTGASRGSMTLAFTMGGVAALLAGACVAPVVIQVVVFATSLYGSGAPAGLALPFVLGLGMAAPWPIAGAGIAALPKPGPWMVYVKRTFAVVILLAAGYYTLTAYSIFRERAVDPALIEASAAEQVKAGWHLSLAEGIAIAAREHKPLLIDMWATWCKNCLVMDRTTLVEPSVVAALDGYVKVKFQAEAPDEQPAVDVMRRFGAVGLPTYVVLTPKD